MDGTARRIFVWLGIAALTLATATIDAAAEQQLADRVSTVESGVVRFSYPLRPDAEICDRGVRIGGQETMWRGRRIGDPPATCTTGVVSVVLRLVSGVVRDVDVEELDDAPAPSSVDLGEVGAREAADYLLSLGRDTASRDGIEDAVFAAVLAAVEEVWRDLLALAQDQSVREDVRRGALFWLGHEAGDAVTVGIAAIAADEREEQDVREAAVFALSQRPGDEGIDPLMELARNAREAETRRSAMFWLAQSEDPRVIAFFEEILLGR